MAQSCCMRFIKEKWIGILAIIFFLGTIGCAIATCILPVSDPTETWIAFATPVCLGLAGASTVLHYKDLDLLKGDNNTWSLWNNNITIFGCITGTLALFLLIGVVITEGFEDWASRDSCGFVAVMIVIAGYSLVGVVVCGAYINEDCSGICDTSRKLDNQIKDGPHVRKNAIRGTLSQIEAFEEAQDEEYLDQAIQHARNSRDRVTKKSYIDMRSDAKKLQWYMQNNQALIDAFPNDESQSIPAHHSGDEVHDFSANVSPETSQIISGELPDLPESTPSEPDDSSDGPPTPSYATNLSHEI